MTRPAKSSFVLDGSAIKIRLEAERQQTGTLVHTDWLRFTVSLRDAPALADIDAVWAPRVILDNTWDATDRQVVLLRSLGMLPDADYAAAAQAAELAREVCEVLGSDFSHATEAAKGHDFYKYRLPILRNAVEVGWVGFLSSGGSPRQSAQARTLHVNLYGMATTFAQYGWAALMADLIDLRKGDITRADLALDFFHGLPGGLDGVMAEYRSGACDSGGRRLKSNCVGDWANGRSRSFYLGSKEAGKQTNIYEKGDQLFGEESNSPWTRIELRYGNKLRVLPSDILRRPADFFAGASDWHAQKLALLAPGAGAEVIKCAGRLPLAVVDAEVTKNLRWALNVAGPTISAAFAHMGDAFLSLCSATKLPGRLSKFSNVEVSAAFARCINDSTAWGASPSPA
jgi:phage replication initiation protein